MEPAHDTEVATLVASDPETPAEPKKKKQYPKWLAPAVVAVLVLVVAGAAAAWWALAGSEQAAAAESASDVYEHVLGGEASPEQELRAVYETFDADGDGTWAAAETLRFLAEECAVSVRRQGVGAMDAAAWAEYVEDALAGDLARFLTMVASDWRDVVQVPDDAQELAAEVQAMFDEADADGNGELTVEELCLSPAVTAAAQATTFDEFAAWFAGGVVELLQHEVSVDAYDPHSRSGALDLGSADEADGGLAPPQDASADAPPTSSDDLSAADAEEVHDDDDDDDDHHGHAATCTDKLWPAIACHLQVPGLCEASGRPCASGDHHRRRLDAGSCGYYNHLSFTSAATLIGSWTYSGLTNAHCCYACHVWWAHGSCNWYSSGPGVCYFTSDTTVAYASAPGWALGTPLY